MTHPAAQKAFRGVLQSAMAALAALLGVAVLLALLGHNPVIVLKALGIGGLGDRYRLAEGLARACPLLLCGLAVAIAFRAQAWNIGVEGQYLLGAVAAVVIALSAPERPSAAMIPLMLLASAGAGALYALPAALLERFRRVPLVLSTILLNFVAIALVSYLTQGPLRGSDPSAAQSDPIPTQAHLPVLVRGTDLHAGLPAALVLSGVLWFLMRWSAWGFEVRASGLNPVAAEWTGIRVPRVRIGVMLVSGLLGGLAGGVQMAGVTHLLNIQASEGFGYVAIAVALLGRLHPLGVTAAAVLLGMLDVGASYLERQPSIGIPADIADVIKGVMVLAVLVTSSGAMGAVLGRRRVPAFSAAMERTA